MENVSELYHFQLVSACFLLTMNGTNQTQQSSPMINQVSTESWIIIWTMKKKNTK